MNKILQLKSIALESGPPTKKKKKNVFCIKIRTQVLGNDRTYNVQLKFFFIFELFYL